MTAFSRFSPPNRYGAILDIGVLLVRLDHRNADGVSLKAFGERGDGLGDRRREHENTPLGGRGSENEFEVFPEAEIEHFVGFVENQRSHGRHVQGTAPYVVAQAPRRSHDDVRAIGQRAALLAHVHAANAGDSFGSGWLIEPFEFAPHLQCQFACRRHGQCQGIGASWNALTARQQFRRHGETESHGLAGTGLR